LSVAYGELGISVTSAAITTFGCGLFLYGGKNLVFAKFATFICATIGISWLVAMLPLGVLSSYYIGFKMPKKDK
jgi:hypothetical protein